MFRFSLLALLCLAAHSVAQDTTRKVEFNRDIRPILSDHCYLCHGPAQSTRKADLRLDIESGAFADTGEHKTIVPGKPLESELWRRISARDDSQRMPPVKSGRKLTAQQIDLVKQWIEQGAVWQNHWAFLAAQRPPLAEVKKTTWPRNAIDRFILAKLVQEKLSPSPEASRETLLRRVTLDLTGLPPTIQEMNDFRADGSEGAYERVVDRLLASPHYGERMVLDWLDAARYADTNGYQTDGTRAMWPWRDWVIDAFNRNMPFDQFTVEQIAGDMLPGATVSQKIATGFHRNHMLNGEGGRIAEESRVDYVVDRVDTTFTVWQGLTAGCARCHDHKYDPLSQKEYYQLYAYFNSIAETGGVDRRNSTAAPTIELPTDEQKAKIDQATKAIAAKEKAAKTLPEAERARALKEIEVAKKELEALKKTVLITMIMEEKTEPRDTFVLVRGLYNKYGDKVKPGLPTALPKLPKDAPNNRLGLARWLVDRNNPLTARVLVNRYWQMFFGTGLVKTVEDFGVQGEPPSHPELLDWLAVEFMESGWDIKRLHKLMLMSATYRQTSKVTPTHLERDPDNRLLGRGPRFRLSPFQLRDQALAVSGLLVNKVGGPPVRPYQPAGLWEDFSFNQIKYTQDKGENLYRRSLYTFWRRSIAPPNMFDTSARQVCTVRQARTNTPLHALILLNDVTFVEAARVWAQRLIKEGGKTAHQRLNLAFRMATGRSPSPAEQQVLSAGLKRALSHFNDHRPAALKLLETGESARDSSLDVVELAAYTAVANMILNLDEVVTKE